MQEMLEVGDPVRGRAGRVLRAAIGVLALFVSFVFVTTQDKAIRVQTPWQDDPYDGLVTLAMCCLPPLLVLVVLRTLLCRRDRPLPVLRVRGLLRASVFGLVIVGATGTSDLVAWLTGTRHADRGPGTPWLVTLVAAFVLAAAALLLLGRGVDRSLPPTGQDDWSADLVPLGELAGTRFGRALRRAPTVAHWTEDHLLAGPYGVRQHPVAWSVLLAEGGAAVLVMGLWLGEGTPLLLIGPLGALVCGAGFVWVLVLANRTLHLTTVDRGRPRLRSLWLGAAVGLDLAFTLRDRTWSSLGLGSSVSTVGQLYLVMTAGAVLGVVAGGLVPLVRRTRA